MARYTSEHKQQTRKRLVESAVSTLRRDGLDSAGLKEIMQHLGLTVGGFYRHFPSKSALVQAAVEQGLAQSLDRLRKVAADNSPESIEQFGMLYLSDAHRRSLAEGCVLAALSSDIARGDSAIKTVCEQGLGKLRAHLLDCLPPDDDEMRQSVWAIIALEVGGLLLARMVASDETSQHILESCRGAVRQLLGARAPRRSQTAKRPTTNRTVRRKSRPVKTRPARARPARTRLG